MSRRSLYLAFAGVVLLWVGFTGAEAEEPRYKQIDGVWHAADATRRGQYEVKPGAVYVQMALGRSPQEAVNSLRRSGDPILSEVFIDPSPDVHVGPYRLLRYPKQLDPVQVLNALRASGVYLVRLTTLNETVTTRRVTLLR